MAKADTSRIEALDAVLAEKRKHEGFLAKLEERRATTPANVFARLRDEYLTKLTDLQVRASIEAESLTEGLKEDEVAVSEIEARLAAITEERIEGELRAEVGEYDPKEWAERLKALTSTLSKIEKERDMKVASFERTRALLLEAGAEPEAAAPSAVNPIRVSAPAPTGAPVARLTPPPVPPPPVVRVSAAAGTPAVQAAAPVAPVVAARVATPAAPAASAPVVRALTPVAPVQAIAAPVTPVMPDASPVMVPAAPAAGSPMAGSPSFDELAFLNSVVGRSSSQLKAEPPAPRQSKPISALSEDGTKRPPASAVTSPAQPPRATTAKVNNDESDSGPLGRPTPRTSQAIKTLKCAECGTLNFPTEWYCERCGGELAAL